MNEPGELFDSELQAFYSRLSQALVSYTPEHFKTIVCTIKPAGDPANPGLVYRIDCPQFPDQGTNNPGQEVHAIASRLYAYWTGKGQPFTGLRFTLSLQADGNWRNSVEALPAA